MTKYMAEVCREQKGYRQCRGMYLGIREGEGGAEVQEVCGAGQKVEGAGGLSESDGWVVEVQKMEVGVRKAEVESSVVPAWLSMKAVGKTQLFMALAFQN